MVFYGNPVAEEVKEPVDDDAGRVAAVGDIVFDVEKRHGRKTWLHPVLDNGGNYLREEAL